MTIALAADDPESKPPVVRSHLHDLMSRRSALALLGASALVSVPTCSRSSSSESRAATSSKAGALHYLGLQEIAGLLKSHQLSPVDLTRHMLDRISKVDVRLKSYATISAEHALAAARAAEQEIMGGRYHGPLHGVPIAVKDLFYTKGTRTMGGMKVFRDFVPDYDGTVVSKLREAGAVILGKLNLTEGAMTGYHPDFDVPVNPWDAGRWPGVSSSGSGVALAAGLCFGALGTDTGGSIRYPSATNGVVGLKPTYGRLSRFGVLPLAESLDHVGPMARRVADVAIMFDAIAGFDPKDPTSLRDSTQTTVGDIARGVDGLRIGLDREYALAGSDPGQAGSIQEALKVLSGLGARIVDVRTPDMARVPEAWFLLCSSEAVAAHAAHYPSRADEYGPYFREFLQLGASATEAQLGDARRVRAQLTSQLTAVLSGVDAVACPSGGAPAFPITKETQYSSLTTFNAAIAAMRAATILPLKSGQVFTMPMDLAGTPTICVPSGFSSDGLPYSIQFVGRRLSEPVLCRIGYAYEQATSWHTRHPRVEAT
jgi:amidase